MQEAVVLRVGDLCGREIKRVNPNPMDGTFAILTVVGTHQKPCSGDLDQGWFDCLGRSLRRYRGEFHGGCCDFSTGVKFTSAGAGGFAMAEKKLRFKVKLEGVEGTVVAWLNAPFDVQKTFGTRARVPVRGTING